MDARVRNPDDADRSLPTLPEKRIVIEFGGGDVDGLVLDSVNADEAQRQMIRAVWRMTHGGEVGRAFRGISLEHFRRLGRLALVADGRPNYGVEYIVTSKEETDERLRIAIRHSAAARSLSESGRVEADGDSADDGRPPQQATALTPMTYPGRATAATPMTYEVQIADEQGLPFNEHCFMFSDNPIPAPHEGDIVTVPGMGELRVGWRHFVFDSCVDSPSLRIVVKCSPVA